MHPETVNNYLQTFIKDCLGFRFMYIIYLDFSGKKIDENRFATWKIVCHGKPLTNKWWIFFDFAHPLREDPNPWVKSDCTTIHRIVHFAPACLLYFRLCLVRGLVTIKNEFYILHQIFNVEPLIPPIWWPLRKLLLYKQRCSTSNCYSDTILFFQSMTI